MADRVYAKILTDTVLEYAPKTYRGISNYNKCEEFMLEDGYLPVVQDSTSTVGNFKYKISSKKISMDIVTFEGKKKTVKTEYIYKEYEEKELDWYKREKKNFISRLKLQKLAIGAAVKYQGKEYHIQLDADGKANILGLAIKAPTMQPDSRILFKTYENIVLSLSLTEFSKLSDAAFTYSEYVVFEKERLLMEIDNCATKEDLDMVIWTDPEAPDITD